MSKLTDWFPPEIYPVHVGVYEIDAKDCHGRAFAYWNGHAFGLVVWEKLHSICIIEAASSDRFARLTTSSCARLFRWRGLSEKPKGE